MRESYIGFPPWVSTADLASDRIFAEHNYFLDVPGQCDMGLGGLQFLLHDAGAGRIKAEELRLQAGRDQSLAKPERKVVIVGHWGSAGQVTRAWRGLSHLRWRDLPTEESTSAIGRKRHQSHHQPAVHRHRRAQPDVV